jgi:hypothetical protein
MDEEDRSSPISPGNDERLIDVHPAKPTSTTTIKNKPSPALRTPDLWGSSP